jgi:hypothetical protein
MITNKIFTIILTTLILFFCSCDSAYNANYIFDNTSNDTIFITYSYHHRSDTTVMILPNEKKTFLIDVIIRKATTFGDCCPCTFESIKTSDTSIQINNSSKWLLVKQNKDRHHDEGFVNCTFIK